MEIRRFGVGHRRPDGPPGTSGVTGQGIHSAAIGSIAELAFGRRAHVEAHTNPNDTWFVVIEGGGWVQVGDERARIAAGEAVRWPPNVLHGAWTELSEMRAIVVEFRAPGAGEAPRLLEGQATTLATDAADRARVDGRVVQIPPQGPDRHSPEGEPW